MTEQQKKKLENRIMYLSFGVLGLAVVFLIITAVLKKAETWILPAGLGVLLAVYWAISDLLPVFWLKALEEKTDGQMKAYWTYAAMDAAGFAGLVYFIANMDSTMGVMLYVVCTMLKRKYRDEYQGKNAKEDLEENSEEELQNALQEDSQE